MDRWEYVVAALCSVDGTSWGLMPLDANSRLGGAGQGYWLVSALNGMGHQGWELVSNGGQQGSLLVFKRCKQDQEQHPSA